MTHALTDFLCCRQHHDIISLFSDNVQEVCQGSNQRWQTKGKYCCLKYRAFLVVMYGVLEYSLFLYEGVIKHYPQGCALLTCWSTRILAKNTCRRHDASLVVMCSTFVLFYYSLGRGQMKSLLHGAMVAVHCGDVRTGVEELQAHCGGVELVGDVP